MKRRVWQCWSIVKHTQHAKHAFARGSGGMPPENLAAKD